MAIVSEHLSVEELEERYVACSDASASRHFQVIWLLARGHTVSQVSATTAFGERWIEQLLTRYNAEGPDALGDLRRHNGASGRRCSRLGGSRDSGAQPADSSGPPNRRKQPSRTLSSIGAKCPPTWPPSGVMTMSIHAVSPSSF